MCSALRLVPEQERRGDALRVERQEGAQEAERRGLPRLRAAPRPSHHQAEGHGLPAPRSGQSERILIEKLWCKEISLDVEKFSSWADAHQYIWNRNILKLSIFSIREINFWFPDEECSTDQDCTKTCITGFLCSCNRGTCQIKERKRQR